MEKSFLWSILLIQATSHGYCYVSVYLVMDIAQNTLQTSEVGDGKIFVYDVEYAMRIRTGTRGTKSVTDDEA